MTIANNSAAALERSSAPSTGLAIDDGPEVRPLPFEEGLARARQVKRLQLTPEQKVVAHSTDYPEGFGAV